MLPGGAADITIFTAVNMACRNVSSPTRNGPALSWSSLEMATENRIEKKITVIILLLANVPTTVFGMMLKIKSMAEWPCAAALAYVLIAEASSEAGSIFISFPGFMMSTIAIPMRRKMVEVISKCSKNFTSTSLVFLILLDREISTTTDAKIIGASIVIISLINRVLSGFCSNKEPEINGRQ